MTEEEFEKFYWSLTDEERVELNRKFAASARKHRKTLNLSEEFVNGYDEKNERYERDIEQKKQVKELLHSLETQLDLVAQRIEARLLDKFETGLPDSLEDKNKKSH